MKYRDIDLYYCKYNNEYAHMKYRDIELYSCKFNNEYGHMKDRDIKLCFCTFTMSMHKWSIETSNFIIVSLA